MSPAGSHKPNTAVPQAFYNAQEGIARLSTETGAGPVGHRAGVRLRAVRPRTEGLHGPRLLRAEALPQDRDGDVGCAASSRRRSTSPTTPARSAARSPTRCATASVATTPTTRSGSVLNHVLLHQTVIGLEAKEQLADGGGAAARTSSSRPAAAAPTSAGSRSRSCPTTGVRLMAVEPLSCPTLTQGRFEYDFGDTAGLTPLMKMYTLGHDFIPPVDPRGRAALPRRLAADLAAGARRPDGGGGLPAGQGVRGRGAVRARRGQDPGAGGGARHPRR